jgi:CheY-like chemotaxis protein
MRHSIEAPDPERSSIEVQNAFAARLVHELRNPLAPIRMALHIMRMSDSDAATLQAARVIIERQLVQLTRLIDDIDEVTQLRTGPLPLRKERTTLRAVLDSALELSRSQREHRQNVLELELGHADMGLQVDRERLAHAVANVLANASKYSPLGSVIEISTTWHQETAQITIADRGIGIPTALLSRIFEPFVRVERAGDGIYDGLGIGLTLARKIVAAHGGTIRAEGRKDGPGTRVSICVPTTIVSGDSNSKEAGHVRTEDGRGLRILIADDNRDAAHTVAMMLELDGHDVRMAHDGLETLAVGQLFNPELVILDIAMPVLNGYQTARQIRERPWGRRAYLVALTGWGHDSDRRTALENGFQDHIVKPAALERLRSVVSAAREVSDQVDRGD